MPLSRHFYALDEVEAVLAYSTTRHDPQETLFWCKELLVSGCAAEAIRTLFEAWLWQKGPFWVSWAVRAWKQLSSDAVSEEDILLAAHQLQQRYVFRDHSLWNLLVLDRLSSTQPDRLTSKTPSWINDSMNSTELSFLRAIHQRKGRTAWWISHALSIDRVWELMEEYATKEELFSVELDTWLTVCKQYDGLLGYRSDAYDDTLRCCFLLSLCLTPSQRKQGEILSPSSLSSSLSLGLEEFDRQIGRKANRRYSIPTACLYGITERGRMSWTEHTRWQLYDIEPYLVGCACWDEALSSFIHEVKEDGTLDWISYDAKEQFYDTYFPDLPPDEWTEKEIAVSHGNGLLRPGDQGLSLPRYAQIYFSKLTRLAWNLSPTVYKLLPSGLCPTVSPTLFSELPATFVDADTIKIKPIRRRFRLE